MKNIIDIISNGEGLPEEIKINGKSLLLLDILESSQVHRCNNRIYDRNEDGDFNITDNTNLSC